MKSKDFSNWLAALSAGVAPMSPERAGAIDSARRIFDGRGTKTVAAVMKAGAPDAVDGGETATRVADLHDTLQGFVSFVRPAAKKAYIDDLKAFVGFLAPFRQAKLDAFVAAVCARLESGPTGTGTKRATTKKAPTALRQTVVDQYVRDLTAAHTHDGAFRDVYERLKSDRKVRAIEAAAIASAFAFETARSTPKKESLRRIWRRQEVFERASNRFGPKSPVS